MSRQATKPFLHSESTITHYFAFWHFVVFIENIRNPIKHKMGACPIRLFPRDVDNHKAFSKWCFPMCFAYILLNKMKKYHNKSSFSIIIRWILEDFDYLCTQISVSWKEIEKFAKQILGSQQSQYHLVCFINHRRFQRSEVYLCRRLRIMPHALTDDR